MTTPPKTNITKEKEIIFLGSMFKNAQPYMLQFHVKESHIHFWTFFSRKMDGFFLQVGDGFVNMEPSRGVILSWSAGSMFVFF